MPSATAEALGLGSYHRLGPAYAVRARTGDGIEAVADAQRAVDSVKRATGDLVLAYVLTMCGDVLADSDDPMGLDHLAEARTVVESLLPIRGSLLDTLTASSLGTPSPQQPCEAPKLVEQLTERETAVLRYLPTTLSQREIAGELFVSAEHREDPLHGDLSQTRCRQPQGGGPDRPATWVCSSTSPR